MRRNSTLPVHIPLTFTSLVILYLFLLLWSCNFDQALTEQKALLSGVHKPEMHIKVSVWQVLPNLNVASVPGFLFEMQIPLIAMQMNHVFFLVVLMDGSLYAIGGDKLLHCTWLSV